jgi:hypothetical protein
VLGVVSLLYVCSYLFEWKWLAKGWKNKGDKVLRRSPRKRGKICGRHFKAPRAVVEERDSDVQVIEKETVADDNDSQV